MPLAIFDLDDTLIAGDSDTEWFEFMISNGLVSAEHRKLNQKYSQDYHQGTLDIDAYLRLICSILSKFELPVLHNLRDRFVAEVVKPMLLTEAQELLARHRNRGDELVIITSTLHFIVEPIAEMLDISHLIAPMPEIAKGRFTGNIIGTPSFQQGKVTRLEEWLATTPFNLTESYGYSDSHNDLPMLRAVDHAVAVDPDDHLRSTAVASGWSVISLRHHRD